MTLPLISILMPVKNTAPFLVECLDSILAQTYSNWELIAVNDHSTDASLAILQQYAKDYPQIVVLNNQERGIIPALRLAYSHSKGQLITRMDSDDIMPVFKLERLSTSLLSRGMGHLATGLVEYFSAETLGNGYQRYAQWLNGLSSTGENFKELYKECVIPSPCWMIYRTDLERCNAFNLDRYPEDYDLCFRFYEAGLICIPTTEVLHHWRDSQGRTSRHDPNYADNNFLAIKIHYFLKLSNNNKRPLVLWGAGKKGKCIAQMLTNAKVPFTWICNNKNKIGKDIYQQRLYPTSHLSTLIQPQIIVAIAEPIAQKTIKESFSKQGLTSMKDFFFFC